MESWDSKIPFLNVFELRESQQMYGIFQVYLLHSCAFKVDNFWAHFHVSLPKKLISCSAKITAIDGNNVLLVTEGEDTIDHSKISYTVINTVVYVCVY